MADIHVQENHPNCIIWLMFSLSCLVFVASAVYYLVALKGSTVMDIHFHYWPIIDAGCRILPHVLVCVIYRLCRFSMNKSGILAVHVIIAVLGFLGAVFGNEHEIYNISIFTYEPYIQRSLAHALIAKDPVIWIISSWTEFIYVNVIATIYTRTKLNFFISDFCCNMHILHMSSK